MARPEPLPLTANVYTMTARHLAEFFGLRVKRLYQLINDEPSFPAPRRVFQKMGRRWLRDEVIEWVRTRPQVTEISSEPQPRTSPRLVK